MLFLNGDRGCGHLPTPHFSLCHFVPCEQELVLHVCSWCQRLGGNIKYLSLAQSINCHLALLGEFSIWLCWSNGQFGNVVCGQKHCWKFLAPDCKISDLGLLSMVKKQRHAYITITIVDTPKVNLNESVGYSSSLHSENMRFIAAWFNTFFPSKFSGWCQAPRYWGSQETSSSVSYLQSWL